ncbi:50S ribosome-binding GTPase [Bowdeniella nasicola]|uniref:50S ribosome-binding GTPase n=1 Tax=Bowdeniella nasicola TaxID=208480 RepID=A0A1H3WK60_9ACTO|nr:GTPase [Bowdeniella nasicola]SDZ86722.1 50S ribosome-binding GTPase [Bowdeniella nasicola]
MATIAEHLNHLTRALDFADGRFDPAVIEAGREVVSNVSARGSVDTTRTVASLFGTTGSGKSSLLNALTKTSFARVAHTRPTTTEPLALARAVDAETTALLDWLEVSQRATSEVLSKDLVLVDLPDIDSVERHHRELSEKMAKVVDVLVWVMDPQKYADAVVHHDFLAPLARHADVTVVVLNQIDQIAPADVPGVVADVKRLLAADGLSKVEVVTTSAKTGAGVTQLRETLEGIASRQEAVRAKSRAEITHVAKRLLAEVDSSETSLAPTQPLVTAAARAAGMDALTSAVARSYQRRSTQHVGWPFVRWVARLRPDPLAKLHIAAGRKDRIEREAIVPTTSLPAPTAVQAANVRSSAHEFVLGSAKNLPDRWRNELVADTQARIPALTDSLDEALARVELPLAPAHWWTLASIIQVLAAIAVLVGGGWLAAIAVASYLQFDLSAPTWHGIPVPTLILLAGLAIGLLLALIGRLTARAGAKRRAAITRSRVMTAVDSRIERQLIQPVREQLEDYSFFVDAARRAAGTR